MCRHGGGFRYNAAQIEGGVVSTTGYKSVGIIRARQAAPYLIPIDHAFGGEARRLAVTCP